MVDVAALTKRLPMVGGDDQEGVVKRARSLENLTNLPDLSVHGLQGHEVGALHRGPWHAVPELRDGEEVEPRHRRVTSGKEAEIAGRSVQHVWLMRVDEIEQGVERAVAVPRANPLSERVHRLVIADRLLERQFGTKVG